MSRAYAAIALVVQGLHRNAPLPPMHDLILHRLTLWLVSQGLKTEGLALAQQGSGGLPSWILRMPWRVLQCQVPILLHLLRLGLDCLQAAVLRRLNPRMLFQWQVRQ